MREGDEVAAEALRDIAAELRATTETAALIARDGPTDGADITSVLAGLIAHLGAQTERLVRSTGELGTASSPTGVRSGGTSKGGAKERTKEEKRAGGRDGKTRKKK